MPANYRREVEYDRSRTSRVNPVEDIEQAILDAEVAELEMASVLDSIGGDDYRHVLTPESF